MENDAIISLASILAKSLESTCRLLCPSGARTTADGATEGATAADVAELGRFSPLLPAYYDGVLVPARLRRLLKPKGATCTVTEPDLHDSLAKAKDCC